MLKGLFVGLAAALAAASVQSDAVGGASGGVVSASGSLQDAGLRVIRSSDGGPTYLGEPPGHVLRPDDAGSGNESPAAVSAPPAVPAEEKQRLRDQIAALEQQLAQARADAQTEQLQGLNDQVAALRAQLAQDQALREAKEAAAREALVQRQQGVNALSDAERELTFGNADVLDELDFAYPALPSPAQAAVQNARRAIQSEDLGAARYWLSVAIAETQGTQLSY